MIRKTRSEQKTPIEQIVESNAPFELPAHNNKRMGALLIHGLLESPFQMRDLGQYLHSLGISVKSILLPGHGTVPGALLNVHYQEWIDCVQYGYQKLAEEVDHILLVGHSTGANLALYHALNGHPVMGLILISPALQIRNPFAAISNAYRLLGGQCKRAEWFFIDPEEPIDYVKYRSPAYNGIYQVHLLSKALRPARTLAHPRCPVFFALSYDDVTINAKTVLKYFSKDINPQSELLLYSAKPRDFKDQRIIVRSSIYPDLHINAASHIGLTISPDNPHYGLHGDFVYASRVEDPIKNIIYGDYSGCAVKTNELLLKLHLTHTRLRRMTFNMDFAYMLEKIGQFINKIQ